MRIKTLLMIIVTFVLTCCAVDVENYAEKRLSPFPRIVHFRYKGHDYIFFDERAGHSSVGGVVHDPDCLCLQE